ncbi:TRAP transporter small permease [Nitratireductor mangrovi]|uniref:TRAP transporter small permease protein n=1 Tax=Nitratireductor mangrovi TaxID=2599600 RepID=A0A5B8KY94_9HYPH|nr:TRAP transporter small permease [Nitratireductor mangrovi]QDZ00549.1 TRAP transporter small permease [Nitratireductor mangrovi]
MRIALLKDDGMEAFERQIGRVAAAVDGAAAIFLAVITALTFLAVILRYVFVLPFPGSFDVSQMLLGVAIFWGIAAAAWRKEHIQVDLVWQLMPPALRRIVDIFADTLFLLFVVALTWMLLLQVGRVRSSGETTFELSIPIWPFHAVAWLGAAFCVLVLVARILHAVVHFRTPAGSD